jgi:arylsulfatase A-like enzyme
MSKILCLLAIPLLATTAFNAVTTASPATEEPSPFNIIFLLADDMGYMDIVALRNEDTDGPTLYETPALDALAGEAMVFTNAFAAGPRCVVARRSLQTGIYDFRPEAIGSGGGIDPSEFTIGEAFQSAGYRTAFIGKWHLGSQEEGKAPEDQGYEVSIASGEFGAPNKSYFPDPQTLSYHLPNLGPAVSKDEYLTDRLTTEARRFISDHVAGNPDQPFFLTLAHYAVHTPLEAKPEDIAYFRQKRDGMSFANHPAGAQMAEDYTVDVRNWQDNVVYAAMMKSYDDSLAGLRGELENLGISDRTIIVVSSDHGGKSTFDVDRNKPAEDFPTSNYPFRLGKTWGYDGGLRIPLLIHWPGKTQSRRETGAFVHGADFYRSFLDLADIDPLPEQHLDSISFVPSIHDPKISNRRVSPHYFTGISDGTGSTAIGSYRKGRYKLVYHINRRFPELFDIRLDPGETNDLREQFPLLTRDLLKSYFDLILSARVRQSSPSASHWSTEVSNLKSYMVIPNAPEKAPSNLQANAIAFSAIDLQWEDNATNETAYLVFRNGPEDTRFEEVAVLPPNTTQWRDTALQADSTYRYKVTAHNMGGWKTSPEIREDTLGSNQPLLLEAKNDFARVYGQETRPLAVLLNDEGESLEIVAVSGFTMGRAHILANSIQYTSHTNAEALDTGSYVVEDGEGNRSTAVIQVEIIPDPANTFADWMEGFGVSFEEQSPLADPDLDGRANFVEFLEGTNPEIMEPNPGKITLSGSDGSSLSTESAFRKGVQGVDSTYFFSTDLQTWEVIFPVSGARTSKEDVFSRESVSFKLPQAGNQFLLHRISRR